MIVLTSCSVLQFYHKSDNQVNNWHSEVFIDNNTFEMSSDVFSVLLLNNLEEKSVENYLDVITVQGLLT